MKKLFYSLLIAAAMVACSDNGGDEPQIGPAETDDIAASSFSLESPESNTFAWTDGARISLFRSNTNERFAYDADGDVFKKEDKLNMGEPFENIYGVYPYKGTNRVSNGEIKTEIPAAQTYSAEGVNFEDAPMVGMSASAASPAMEFKNLCGVATIKLYGSAIVKSIAVTGNNGEVLAGTAMAEIGEDGEPTFDIVALQNNTVTLTAEEPVALGATAEEATPFYLLVPPTTFENGFIVTVVDSYGNVRKKNFKVDEENPAAAIARNEVVTIAEYELAEKKPTQTILDVQFNADGSATDAGIYGLDVQLMGEPTNTYVYKHSKFKKNNIARFHNVRINNDITKHSYYKVDYSGEDETSVAIRETIADGFALEIVTLASCANWDWWLSPVATDAFRFLLKGGAANYEWCYSHNNNGGWFTSGTKINTTYDFNKYHHDVYMYDADNMQIQVYHNGVLLGLVENVAEFKPGQLLTIGGYGDTSDNLYMQWNGEVALVKMYDQILTPEEIAEKYNDLKLPEASEAPAASVSAPLIDIKWNSDKTATNAGTQTDLEVTAVPDDNVAIINVDGVGNVVDFNAMPNNNWNKTGFYQIDYSANEAFKNKMKDGFTIEYLCVADHNPGDFYSRPVATDTFGVHLKCDPGAPSHYWQMWYNGNNSVWHSMGNTSNKGYSDVFVVASGKVMTSYIHVVIVYNPETKMYFSYIDGHGNQGWGGVGEFNVGNFLGVPGMPGNPSGMQHGWPGKVAMVRMYDEPFNVEQILSRYNELKPAIEKLNPTIGQ